MAQKQSSPLPNPTETFVAVKRLKKDPRDFNIQDMLQVSGENDQEIVYHAREYFNANIARLERLRGKRTLQAVFMVALLARSLQDPIFPRGPLSALLWSAKHLDLRCLRTRSLQYSGDPGDPYYAVLFGVYEVCHEEHQLLEQIELVRMLKELGNPLDNEIFFQSYSLTKGKWYARVAEMCEARRGTLYDFQFTVLEQWLSETKQARPSFMNRFSRRLGEEYRRRIPSSLLQRRIQGIADYSVNGVAELADASQETTEAFLAAADQRPAQPMEDFPFTAAVLFGAYDWLLRHPDSGPNEEFLRHLLGIAVACNTFKISETAKLNAFMRETIQIGLVGLKQIVWAYLLKAERGDTSMMASDLANIVADYDSGREGTRAKEFAYTWQDLDDSVPDMLAVVQDTTFEAAKTWLKSSDEAPPMLFSVIENSLRSLGINPRAASG